MLQLGLDGWLTQGFRQNITALLDYYAVPTSLRNTTDTRDQLVACEWLVPPELAPLSRLSVLTRKTRNRTFGLHVHGLQGHHGCVFLSFTVYTRRVLFDA